MDWLKQWSRSRYGRLVTWVFFAAAGVSLVEMGLVIIAGGDWNHGFRVSNPMGRVRAACFFWFGWYFLRYGIHQGRREWAGFAGKVSLFVFSTATALLAAEIGLRFFFMQLQSSQSLDRAEAIAKKLNKETIKSSHPLAAIIRKSEDRLLVYELRPGLDMDFGHNRLRTNRQGFRASHDYQTEKPLNCVRIVGLGDSGMFGWGNHQGQDYLSVLESNLNARAIGRTYEVLNLAVPGYNSQLEVQMMKSRGLAYKPDIVVVGWCDNDFGLPFFIPQEGQWFRKDVSFLYYLLFDRKRLPEVAVSTINDRRDFDEGKVPEALRQGVDIKGVRDSFLELMELGRKHGFKVVVMGPMGKAPPLIFKEIGIPFYNTIDRIDAKKYPEDYLVFFMHPAAAGHRVLAEYLEEDLRARGWL
ncbi:MAG: SGNH/GDSL hydrolase family protein [bacterium]